MRFLCSSVSLVILDWVLDIVNFTLLSADSFVFLEIFWEAVKFLGKSLVPSGLAVVIC